MSSLGGASGKVARITEPSSRIEPSMSSVDGLPRSSGPPAHGTLAGFPRVTTTWGRIVRLTVVGGLAFWVANLAISLTVWPGSATAVAILTPQQNDGDFTNQFELASALVGMANE